MDKLVKYNQIIYAILGSLGVLLLLFGGINILMEFFPGNRHGGDPNTLVTEEEARALADKDLRKQVISMEGMQDFDTASGIYIIPITHKTLDEFQQRREVDYGLLSMKSGSGKSYYYSRYYNNLVLYDFADRQSYILFNERINIDRFQSIKTANDHLILITGWKEDTNKDGRYDDSDKKALYLYIHSLQELRSIDLQDFKFINFQYLEKADKLVINVIFDINGDGLYDISQDPEILLEYSMEEKVLRKLIEDKQLNKLQHLIDGEVD
ncbi:hypothetical protein QQ020_27810 [Fulvivirgaceae bacterium BMA12]|uniref:Uncharacterized protein n=1 Tax=Agaribacillus aureus TaxID=3051825 RepID=A0ABT8LGR3_9BACT|nr:hypothetical protein [Fulvivirgaceae bacterium BMA12]